MSKSKYIVAEVDIAAVFVWYVSGDETSTVAMLDSFTDSSVTWTELQAAISNIVREIEKLISKQKASY